MHPAMSLSLRRPSSDLGVLGAQITRELNRLQTDPTAADPDLFQAYLQHAQALAWYRVAEGNLNAPREVLDCLSVTRSFEEQHFHEQPDMSATAAAEIHFTLSSLRLAEEALEQLRAEDRLADSRSETERAVLSVLAAHRGQYLRRGQVHRHLQLADPPSPARVGQILVKLDEEGLLQRINARAQGNPDSAFYCLSPRGFAVAEDLGLESDADQPDAVIDMAIQIAIDPANNEDKRRIATGALNSLVMGNEGQAATVWKRLFSVGMAGNHKGNFIQVATDVARGVELGQSASEASDSCGTFLMPSTSAA